MKFGYTLYTSHSKDDGYLCESQSCYHDTKYEDAALSYENGKLQIYSLSQNISDIKRDKSDLKLLFEINVSSLEFEYYLTYGLRDSRTVIILVLFFEKVDKIHHITYDLGNDIKSSSISIKEFISEFSLNEIDVLNELGIISPVITLFNKTKRNISVILVVTAIVLVNIYFYWFKSSGQPIPNLEINLLHSIPAIIILSVIMLYLESRNVKDLISKIGEGLVIRKKGSKS